MYQVPSVFRLDDVGKRRHRRAIESGHENLVEVVVCGAALEAGTRRKIIGADRLIVTVGKRGGGRTIAASFGPMALPTFQLGKQLFAMLDALERKCRLGGDRGRGGLVFRPPPRRQSGC